MCCVGTGLRLYGRGYDRHLYDVGILLVWSAVGVYECLGVTDGMEVAGVLCQACECCLTIDDGVQALRHGHLHGVVVLVLVRLTVIVWHCVQLLCYALSIARAGAQSMWFGV